MGAAAPAAAYHSGQMGRRDWRQQAEALLLVVLLSQLAGPRCAAHAAAEPEAAEPALRKHITLRGRIRGGGIYSTAVSKSNSALQQLLAEYSERHEAVLRAPTEQPQKYVVSAMSDGYGGLGNQLPIMVNGFLLALLTNRTFFIDYPLHTRFFTHSLDLSWANHQARLPNRGAALVRELKYEQPFGSDFYLTTDFGAPEWLAKDIIEINCDGDYEAAPLLSNRNYAAFREKHFPSGEVFHPLAEWLLRTKPEFQDKVDAVRREKFRPFTIGLQIRKWKGHGEGGFDWAPPPSLKAFASAARALQRQRGLPDRDVAFFIASDAAEVYEEAALLLGAEQVIRTDNGVGTSNWNGNPGSPESAILDWKLLTECDDLLITVGSSFGQIAAAYAGITPVNLVHGEHANVHNPYFFRAINSEPCYYGSKGVLRHASEEATAALQSNPLWLQYASCH